MKFRGCGACDPTDPDADEPCVPGVDDVARISDVLYENVYMDRPRQGREGACTHMMSKWGTIH